MAIISGEVKVHSANKELEIAKVFNDESADETASDAVDIRNADKVTLFVESGAGVSGGVVKLETAVNENGPWFVAGSVTVNAASTGFAVSLGGGDDGIPAKYARARIETVISNGTIDAYIAVQR